MTKKVIILGQGTNAKTLAQQCAIHGVVRKPVVIKSICPKCGSDRWIKEGEYCECTECMTLFKQTAL